MDLGTPQQDGYEIILISLTVKLCPGIRSYADWEVGGGEADRTPQDPHKSSASFQIQFQVAAQLVVNCSFRSGH